MITTIKLEMETKDALKVFKRGDWEPFNEVVKRLISLVLKNGNYELNEVEKVAVLKAIKSVEKGKVKSFDDMLRSIEKKRGERAKKGVKRVIRGDTYALGS